MRLVKSKKTTVGKQRVIQTHSSQKCAERLGAKPRSSPSQTLQAALRTYLHIDDPYVVDVSLATVVGNLREDAPIWLLLVNPPSTGKTEFVQLFTEIDFCEWLAEVTENTFLSGLKQGARHSDRQPAHDRKNSLLFRWTDPAIRTPKSAARVMLIQDLTGLITQDRRKRDTLFGQLRQIYDGRLVKSTGMGEDLVWEGYLGLLGAVTPVIDDVAELNSILGERFVLYRPCRTDPCAEAKMAIAGRSSQWRKEVSRVAAQVVEEASKNLRMVSIPDCLQTQLIALAQFAGIGRTGVSRDGYTRSMTSIPATEGPARLACTFSGLLQGICAGRGLSVPGEEEMKILAKVARDSIPAIRQVLIEALWRGPQQKNALVERTHFSKYTLGYRLEDLMVIGSVTKLNGSYALTEEFQEICRQGKIFPAITSEAETSSSASAITEN